MDGVLHPIIFFSFLHFLSSTFVSAAITHEIEPMRDIRCEFCGEYFENRKGLSSHARSHLRQMGITEWSVNGSPIDTLREIIHKRGLISSQSDKEVKTESNQNAVSPSWENAGGSEGVCSTGYPSTKFRKTSLGLLPTGSRLHKQSLNTAGTSPTAKILRISPLAKRAKSDDGAPVETSSLQTVKVFSPLPQDYSIKKKSSPDKSGHQGALFTRFPT